MIENYQNLSSGSIAWQLLQMPTNIKKYARIDSTNTVVNLEMATEEFVANNPESGSFVPSVFGTGSMLFYVHIGMVYNKEAGYFAFPKPHPSWILDENYTWIPPVPFPDQAGDYEWDESTISWKLI